MNPETNNYLRHVSEDAPPKRWFHQQIERRLKRKPKFTPKPCRAMRRRGEQVKETP